MNLSVKKYKFLPVSFFTILLLAIFLACGLISPALEYNTIQVSSGNPDSESLSIYGEDLSDLNGWLTKKQKTEDPGKNISPDTIIPISPIRLKLEDPDYDVRYEKGSIMPWDEIRSIYLRRQIPSTNLAAISWHSVG